MSNTFKISGPKWNGRFILTDRLYSVSGIQYYVNYNIKNHKTFTGNPLIKICINKIEIRSTLTIQLEYFLELLMKLLNN